MPQKEEFTMIGVETEGTEMDKGIGSAFSGLMTAIRNKLRAEGLGNFIPRLKFQHDGKDKLRIDIPLQRMKSAVLIEKKGSGYTVTGEGVGSEAIFALTHGTSGETVKRGAAAKAQISQETGASVRKGSLGRTSSEDSLLGRSGKPTETLIVPSFSQLKTAVPGMLADILHGKHGAVDTVEPVFSPSTSPSASQAGPVVTASYKTIGAPLTEQEGFITEASDEPYSVKRFDYYGDGEGNYAVCDLTGLLENVDAYGDTVVEVVGPVPEGVDTLSSPETWRVIETVNAYCREDAVVMAAEKLEEAGLVVECKFGRLIVSKKKDAGKNE